MDDDIEVAVPAAARSRLAGTRGTQARSLVNACGNVELDTGGLLTAPLSLAAFARLVDGLAHAMALRAGLGYLEESARGDHLASAAAEGAGGDLRSLGGA